MIHPVDKKRVESAFYKALHRGQDQHVFEYRLRAKDGGWRWILDRGKVVSRDAGGKPLLASGTYSDIDNRRRAEIALCRSQARLAKSLDAITRNRNLLNRLGDVQNIFIGHPDNREAFDQLLNVLLDFTGSEYGFIGEVLYKKNGLPYLKTHAQTNISWNEATRKFYEENAPNGLEFTNLKTLFGAVITSGELVTANSPSTDPRRVGLPPGHPPLNRFLGVPIKLGDQFIGMVGLANRSGGYDESVVSEIEPILATYGNLISARRERIRRELAEKRANIANAKARKLAEQVNSTKDIFLASTSHEIRTPMNGVVGMVDLMWSDPNFPECYMDHIKTIRDSSLSLLRVINGILDFSKIESGEITLESIPCSVREVIDGACSNFLPLINQKRLILNIRIAADVPHIVFLDPVRLKQVLLNLISNAVKFSIDRPGIVAEVTVKVSVCDSVDSTAALMFLVIDSGIGMSPDTMRNLSKPFSQADPTITRRFGGTGLGLSITTRLLTLMAGHLSFESCLGEGSRITACIPIGEDTGSDLANEIDVQGLNCLFVEENLQIFPQLLDQLESTGINLEVVPDLVAAKKQAVTDLDWVILRVVDETELDVTTVIGDFAGLPNLRQVIIAKGLPHYPRIVGVNVVVLGGETLSRQVLLHAISVVANRSSPHLHWGNDFTAIRGEILPLVEAGAGSVLVAEDDLVNQQVITRQLQLLGFSPEIAVDGADALAKWRAGNYELLLVDLHMPVKDGYSLVRAIREEESESRRLPILAFTANALKEEKEKALRFGMDDYLTKPIQIVELRAALQKWLLSHRNHIS